MFGVSFTELVVVFLIALLLFGPEQLPQMARQLGRLMAELRKGSDAVRREFYNSVYPPAQELTKDFANAGKDLRALKSELLQQNPINSAVSEITSEVKQNLSIPTHDNTQNTSPPGGGRSQATKSDATQPPHPTFEDDKGDS